MKKFFQRSLNLILTVLTILSVATGVLAGSLTPTASPAGIFYTLTDIYNKLIANGTATEGIAFTAPTISPAATHYTFTQLYNLIPTITAATIRNGTTVAGITGIYPSAASPLDSDTAAVDATASDVCSAKESWGKDGTLITGTFAPSASRILVGTTYCGTAGVVFKDQFNGSGTDANGTYFTGGAYGNGGIDDYAFSGIPSNRYAGAWTACNASNNYCGTGLAGADAKDEGTGLVWSTPCNGTGCSTFSENSPGNYSWDATDTDNGGLTAYQMCSSGTHGQTGWVLPSQKELIQGYIDGMYGNLDAAGDSRIYISATLRSENLNTPWVVNARKGHVFATSKSTTDYFIRCVKRPS